MAEPMMDSRTADALAVVGTIKDIVCNPQLHLHNNNPQELEDCCTIGKERIRILFQLHALIREESDKGLLESLEVPALGR